MKGMILRGTAWAFMERFIPQIITLLVTSFLARMLSPKDFGLFALAGIGVGFLSLFSDYGFCSAIIQKKELCEEDTRTAFAFITVIGIALFVLMYFFADRIALLFGEPDLPSVLIVLSTSFLISPLLGIQSSLLQRRMMFRQLANARIVGALSYAGVVLVMAVAGYGVWSLVGGMIAEQVIRVPMVRYYSGWRYRIGFNRASVAALFNYGIYLFMFNVINYASMQLDKVIIGRGIGAGMVGYYALSDRMSMKLFEYVGSPVGKVLFPALSRIKEDVVRLHKGVVDAFKYMAFLVLPASFLMCAMAPELVRIALGSKWMHAIPLFRIMAITGGFIVIGGLVGPVFLAKARTDIHFKLGFINSAVRIGGVVIGARWGALGIATALCAVQICITFWNPFVMCRTVDLRYRNLMSELIRPFVVSLTAVGAVLLVGSAMNPGLVLTKNIFALMIKLVIGLMVCFCTYRVLGVRIEEVLGRIYAASRGSRHE